MQLTQENQEKLIIGFLAASCVLLLIHLGQMMSSKKEGFGATGKPGMSAHLRGAGIKQPGAPQSAHLRSAGPVRQPGAPQSAHLRGVVAHNMSAHLANNKPGVGFKGHVHAMPDKSMVQFKGHLRQKPRLD